MSILLLGASGRTGRLIAEKLHAAAMPYRALIRNAAKRDEFVQLGATPVIGDFTSDLSQAFEGMQTVIYAAGSAESEGAEQERQIDRDAVIASADYAKRLGVRRLIVISALAAYDPEQAPAALRHYAQMKRESDDYVVASGLDYLVLRPGALTMDPGVGTIQITSDAASRHQALAREDVAAVVLRALQADLARKVIGFTGGSVLINEALASL
ncbi:SDR family oxidoreductase [Paraburkholderia sp. DHOC27]|uniref:SDR family oxidoreductase n=1 Tax=Paraburkholderia sp. DHOC27 TaxID=2303330 RepID=UPI000E3C729E|nr:SDR family oxidoreductase [Paraburkholderia sp. DHOC27]RFU49671.1 SDR family oxidoreductase [Paraburkholderia sp. DHOC27]